MLLSAPAVILSAAVSILAALICLSTAILVGRMRGRYKVAPPAMTGSPEVERALRVQGNTTEQVIIFLPLLWVATLYFQGWIPPAIGLVWCLGRIAYAVGYMGTPKNRMVGFAVGVFSSIALAILGMIGVIHAWSAATAV